MNTQITIKDIAREAGVSITAVSFVLNGKEGSVSKATAERILNICKKYNFKPNYFASSLKSKATKTVGCIIPDIENNYYSRLLAKLEEYLRLEGYDLIISNVGYDIDNSVNTIYGMLDKQVASLVIVPPLSFFEEVNKLVETIRELPIPYIVLDRKLDDENNKSVSTDDVKGGYIATKYLLDKNHKRIAVITGPNKISSSLERLKGYKSALKSAGIQYDESLVFEGDYHFESGERCANEILNKDLGVDAIFAFNDMMAYGVYRALNERGIVIGKDISVVGYDDNYFSSLISPSLTTVRQDIDNLCRSVIDELLDEEQNPETVLIEPTLIERMSVKQ